MEDLDLVNMTARAKGKGSSAKTGLNREMAYSRPGTFQRLIRGACENAGVIVIMVDPKGTSITCHQCGHSDENSRVSQGKSSGAPMTDVRMTSTRTSMPRIILPPRRKPWRQGGREGRLKARDTSAGLLPRVPQTGRESQAPGGIARAPAKGMGAVHSCI